MSQIPIIRLVVGLVQVTGCSRPDPAVTSSIVAIVAKPPPVSLFLFLHHAPSFLLFLTSPHRSYRRLTSVTSLLLRLRGSHATRAGLTKVVSRRTYYNCSSADAVSPDQIGQGRPLAHQLPCTISLSCSTLILFLTDLTSLVLTLRSNPAISRLQLPGSTY